jgi:hypothetical protein
MKAHVGVRARENRKRLTDRAQLPMRVGLCQVAVQHAALAFALVEEKRQRGGYRTFSGGSHQIGKPGTSDGDPDALDVVVLEGAGYVHGRISVLGSGDSPNLACAKRPRDVCLHI